jgi:ornithine cyclodeaminase/thiomorpholine-carboxylate dehydrogenase
MSLPRVDEHQLAGADGADVAPLPVLEQALGDDQGQGKRVAVLGHPLPRREPEADQPHGAAVRDLLPAERTVVHGCSALSSPGERRRPLSSVGTSELLVLARPEVERLLDLDELVDALAAAFVELSAGRTSVPPRVAARSSSGLLAAMPGYLPGVGLETKLVTVFAGNHPRGLPSHQALIALFDEDTGRPLALMDGTYITAVRTAAASALSARLLARPEAAVLAILGAGVQAQSHLEALPRVASFHEVRIASRSPDHALALASTSPRARAMRSFEEAVRGADVVCCCTDSATPILDFSWLSAGAHVTSVGANQTGPELDPETIRRGRLFVESRVAFQPPPAGAAELAGVDPSRATELGEVVAGSAPGRQDPDEITVYKSMGHAVEDAAAAGLVYRRARREGAGQPVAL